MKKYKIRPYSIAWWATRIYAISMAYILLDWMTWQLGSVINFIF